MVLAYWQCSEYGLFFDVDVIDSVPLRLSRLWLNNSFSEHKVTAAVQKMARKSAGDSKYPP
jgi:hypothetical protein